MYEPVLSIDLGASYTKVSHRTACNPSYGRAYNEFSKLLKIEKEHLIPSLAIHVRKSRTWYFGQRAAKLPLDATFEVFQNWKANLFDPKNNKDSAAAVIVAEHFFRWLKGELEEIGINPLKSLTRVAMPFFKNFDEQALLLARCMELSGWNSPFILKATEPHANILGLFSGGRNVANCGQHSPIYLNYGKMFGPDSVYIRHARMHGKLLTVAVIDIGAFTTDTAFITFDHNAGGDTGDGLSHIRQESHVVGVINELDRPLFAELRRIHGIDWTKIGFESTEKVKMELYHGGNYAIERPGVGGVVNLGSSKVDRDAVSAQIHHFSNKIWSQVRAFFQQYKPAAVYLTGGGSLIPEVAATLIKHLKQMGIAATPANQISNRPDEMHRVATAFGGASLILQAPGLQNDPDDGLPRRLPKVPEPLPDDYATCFCNGANKDCCYCGGRGFYPR